jgi:hypothetical protein
VIRVENLTLEGFPNEVQNEVLEVLRSVCLFAFLAPPVTQAQHYKQTNLVSNIVGMAPTIDPNLKNPWGLTRSSTTPAQPGSPWWIGNNNSGNLHSL